MSLSVPRVGRTWFSLWHIVTVYRFNSPVNAPTPAPVFVHCLSVVSILIRLFAKSPTSGSPGTRRIPSLLCSKSS